MTRRATIIGSAGALLLCMLAFFNDRVMDAPWLILHFLPSSVFGTLLVLKFVVNPILGRLRASWRLSPAEMAVVIAIPLMVCAIPAGGLLDHFHNALIMPQHFARVEPGWRDGATPDAAASDTVRPAGCGIVSRVPPRLLPDVDGADGSVVLDGYVNGLGEGDRLIPVTRVPWRAWLPVYRYWLPLVLCLAMAMIGLSLVLHRQWSRHEHLPYPIAQFASVIMGADSDEENGGVLRSRAFWTGAAVIFIMHMNNYACTWWPDLFIPIARRVDFSPLLRLVPWLAHSPVPVNWIGAPPICFAIIGLAFLLPTQISLSVGLAPYAFALVTGALTAYGVGCSTRFGMEPSIVLLCYAGGWCGMFLVVLYNGRQYFTAVLRRALGRRIRHDAAPEPPTPTPADASSAAASCDNVQPHVVWGGRAFLVGILAFVLLLVVGGLNPFTAVLFAGLTVVIQVVASRVLAEAGVFHLHPHFFPVTVVWALFGAAAIGPDQLLMLGLFSAVLLTNPREALLPFVATALKIGETAKAPVPALARRGAAMVIVGLLVAAPITLYLHYQYGAMLTGDGWTAVMMPKLTFEASVKTRHALAAQGLLEQALHTGPSARLGMLAPDGAAVTAFFVTFGLVLAFTALRYRFAWWPLHPVMLLMLATAQSMSGGFSFLLGWLVKSATVRYGGDVASRSLKPLMFGLIAGEVMAGVVPMLVGIIYWIVTRTPPPSFSVFR
ncbi:MAG: hypothetical protein HN742_28900 [Lentisphaerae bacterium]|jgi:hypothetical protein|nr:hypothetical protein [Lentisphaerota bacterium]MBT4814984.1 hypothetical protein [Lentisphaerota bacterium]MBT5611865.1 hypothetical protein [Lentisphaerota bacterium]MBT7845926.1 hypothetical protein [Lentisphaerota bacterium]